VVKVLNGMGSDAFPTDSPEAFTKIVEEDYKNYEQTIKEIGIEKK
jgi:tripartite-type tricarboxylate transporter receptor subunit TctC